MKRGARERNPLGIGIGDIIKWGAIGIAGFWLVSRTAGDTASDVGAGAVQRIGDNIGQGIRTILGGGDGPRVQIVSISHPTLPPNGRSISIEWTVNHKGPAEHFRAGLAIATGFPSLPLNFAQRMEVDLYTGDDPQWASYSTGASFVVNALTIGEPFFYGYIDDDRGHRITQGMV